MYHTRFFFYPIFLNLKRNLSNIHIYGYIYIYICVEGKNVIYVELGVNKKRISNLKMRAVIKSSSFLT